MGAIFGVQIYLTYIIMELQHQEINIKMILEEGYLCRWQKQIQKFSGRMQIKMTMSLHQSERPSLKSLQIRNAGEGVEKREASYIVGGNVNWSSHYGEQYRDYSEN